MVYPIQQLKNLSLKQKIRIVEELWDDIAEHEEKIPVAEWQKKELEKRHKNYLKNPKSAAPWRRVKKQILG